MSQAISPAKQCSSCMHAFSIIILFIMYLCIMYSRILSHFIILYIYRVPQCLIYLKILEYSDALMDTLRKSQKDLTRVVQFALKIEYFFPFQRSVSKKVATTNWKLEEQPFGLWRLFSLLSTISTPLSILCCSLQLICRGVRERLTANPSLCPNLSPDGVYPCVIDFFLWDYATRHYKELADIPFHRTLTVFY